MNPNGIVGTGVGEVLAVGVPPQVIALSLPTASPPKCTGSFQEASGGNGRSRPAEGTPCDEPCTVGLLGKWCSVCDL